MFHDLMNRFTVFVIGLSTDAPDRRGERREERPDRGDVPGWDPDHFDDGRVGRRAVGIGRRSLHLDVPGRDEQGSGRRVIHRRRGVDVDAEAEDYDVDREAGADSGSAIAEFALIGSLLAGSS